MSKITRRSYKRKKIVMGVALFGAIALVSTGFAAWVLSASASQDKGMNMTVGTVDPKSMNIVIDGIYTTSEIGSAQKVADIASGISQNDEFAFDAPVDDNSGRVRYGSNGDTEKGELMSLSIFGHVENAQNMADSAHNGLTISLKDTIPAGLATASAAGEVDGVARDAYIVLPDCFTSAQVIDPVTPFVDEANGTKTAYFRYDVAFAWGAEFGDVNPSLYFDAAGASVSDERMQALLDDMKAILDTVASFEVTITAIPD